MAGFLGAAVVSEDTIVQRCILDADPKKGDIGLLMSDLCSHPRRSLYLRIAIL